MSNLRFPFLDVENGVLYGTKSVGEKNPICDVSLKIMPKLVLWDQVAKAGVVNAGY